MTAPPPCLVPVPVVPVDAAMPRITAMTWGEMALERSCSQALMLF